MKTPKPKGRPPKRVSETKGEAVLVRLEAGEKQAFQAAAKNAGLSLSSWMRERLRSSARRELEDANMAIPFLKNQLLQ